MNAVIARTIHGLPLSVEADSEPYTLHQWECPECGAGNESAAELTGLDVTCAQCDSTAHCESSVDA